MIVICLVKSCKPRFGQTTLQRHLAAFEASLLDAAAGLLALARASGLAVAGTSTAALAGHSLTGASGRFQS